MWKLITHILKFTLQTFTKKAFSLLKISRDLWWAISIPHEYRLLWGTKRLGLLIQLQMKAAKATYLQFYIPIYLYVLEIMFLLHLVLTSWWRGREMKERLENILIGFSF